MENKTKIALSVVTVAVLVFLITAIAIRGNQSKSEFTPPPFEANAVAGVVENTDEFYGEFDLPYEYGENKCSVGLEPMPSVSNDEIKIDFSSNKENTVWVRLIITDDNKEIVAESGILKPGEYVETLKLKKAASSGDEFKVKILTFEPDTYYSTGSASANIKLK